MNIPDNYSQWEAHDRKQEKARSNCYHCECCGRAIFDDYRYEINEEILCTTCMEDRFRKFND